MKHRYSIILLLVLALTLFNTVSAQERKELLLAPMDVFVPHWQVGGALGAGYDVGEAKFFDLVSPAVQFTAAYHFNEFVAARLAVSGISSKNRYAFPEEKYMWNYVQPALDAKFDLSSLFLGWVPDNVFRPYVFAGAGLNLSFNNDDAEKADQRWGVDFEKRWNGSRLNPVVRGGVGFDWWLTEQVALTGEANVNMLPDHYNSKRGKHDNRDWRFNALVGLRFRIGDYNRRTDAYWMSVRKNPPVVQPVEPPVKKITKAQADLTVNVQFVINQSVIRDTELQKLYELTRFLQEHPDSHILLTGYADKETGNAVINEHLSRERADAVAEFLVNRGIARSRIHTDHKGDRIQPFDFPAQNRVCICIVLNPKYL